MYSTKTVTKNFKAQATLSQEFEVLQEGARLYSEARHFNPKAGVEIPLGDNYLGFSNVKQIALSLEATLWDIAKQNNTYGRIYLKGLKEMGFIKALTQVREINVGGNNATSAILRDIVLGTRRLNTGRKYGVKSELLGIQLKMCKIPLLFSAFRASLIETLFGFYLYNADVSEYLEYPDERDPLVYILESLNADDAHIVYQDADNRTFKEQSQKITKVVSNLRRALKAFEKVDLALSELGQLHYQAVETFKSARMNVVQNIAPQPSEVRPVFKPVLVGEQVQVAENKWMIKPPAITPEFEDEERSPSTTSAATCDPESLNAFSVMELIGELAKRLATDGHASKLIMKLQTACEQSDESSGEVETQVEIGATPITDLRAVEISSDGRKIFVQEAIKAIVNKPTGRWSDDDESDDEN